jgi:hypothetical protein
MKRSLTDFEENPVFKKNLTTPVHVPGSYISYISSARHLMSTEISQNYSYPYSAPKQTYETPKQTYEAPRQTYEAPKQTYEAPRQTYEAPKQTYESPRQTYEAPRQTYESPRQTYETIKGITYEDYYYPESTYTPTVNINKDKEDPTSVKPKIKIHIDKHGIKRVNECGYLTTLNVNGTEHTNFIDSTKTSIFCKNIECNFDDCIFIHHICSHSKCSCSGRKICPKGDLCKIKFNCPHVHLPFELTKNNKLHITEEKLIEKLKKNIEDNKKKFDKMFNELKEKELEIAQKELEIAKLKEELAKLTNN